MSQAMGRIASALRIAAANSKQKSRQGKDSEVGGRTSIGWLDCLGQLRRNYV